MVTGLRTWWRRCGGLLVAVLALALVVPAIADAGFCTIEQASVVCVNSVSGDTTVQAADPADSSAKGQLGAQGCLCQHGHCHHSGWIPASGALEPVAHRTAAAAALRAPGSGERPARFATRLERPPRG